MKNLDIKYQTVGVQMPWREVRELRLIAKSEGTSLSELIRRAVRKEFFNQN